jgi:hypothetical protein
MVVLFDSDKVGIALGLVVFLTIILMGIHGNLPAAVVIARGLVGFTAAYFLGFLLSRVITNSLVGALAAERARRLAERAGRAREQSKQREGTEEEDGTP